MKTESVEVTTKDNNFTITVDLLKSFKDGEDNKKIDEIIKSIESIRKRVELNGWFLFVFSIIGILHFTHRIITRLWP